MEEKVRSKLDLVVDLTAQQFAEPQARRAAEPRIRPPQIADSVFVALRFTDARHSVGRDDFDNRSQEL